MELFEFKRYLGDEKGISSKQDGESGLDGYLERVKQRKRQREAQEKAVEEDSNVNDDDGCIVDSGVEFSKKNKKKKFNQNFNKGDVLNAHLERVKLRKQKREEKLTKLEVCEEVLEEIVDSNVEIKNDANNESSLKLTSKLRKEKKKQRVVENDTDDVEKKEKKRRVVEDTNNTDDIEVSPSTLELTRKSKKEKKKKLDVVIEDSNITDEAAAEEDGEEKNDESKKPKSSKKKKKKKAKDEKEVVQESLTTNIVEAEKEVQPVTFEVLGAHSFKDKVKVKRVLPRWLAEPTIISSDLSSGKSISEVGRLHYKLVQNLKDMGITDMFPVQLEVIPYQLKFNNIKIDYLWPRDLCVAAPTGSGKTLAFALPLLQAYFSCPKSSLFALVIAPIQELALQVAQVFRSAAKGTGIKIGCITGGSDKDIEAKQLVYKRDDGSYVSLVNILIATPGRLMQHFFLTPGFNLKNLKFIVIDEADRVVDQKSLNWLHLIEKQCNPTFNGNVPPVSLHNLQTCARGPQKLLFSATLSQDPEKLLKFNLFQPKLITSIVKNKVIDKLEDDEEQIYCKFPTPTTIKELYAVCNINKKPLLLHKLISDGWRRVIVFTKTCIEANRLCMLLKILNPEVKVGELTSLMILNKRQASVNNFSSDETSVLVCSDRMARGIDIKCVDYVIIYDPPKDVKGYIHKAGRTGRAGSSGTSIIILTQKQEQTYFEMLKKSGKTNLEQYEYETSVLDEFIPTYEEALTSLKSHVSALKNESVNLSIREKRTKTIINLKRRKRKTALSRL